MKKLFLINFCLLMALSLKASSITDDKTNVKFNFTVNSESEFETETHEDFYIVTFDNKSAHDLYVNILSSIASLYKSPEKVTEKVEDKTIVINALAQKLIDTYTTVPTQFDFYYRLEFNFKDGKIRVKAPRITGGNINFYYKTGSYYPGNYVLYHVQKELDEPSIYVKKVEKYFNDLIKKIVYSKQEDDDW